MAHAAHTQPGDTKHAGQQHADHDVDVPPDAPPGERGEPVLWHVPRRCSLERRAGKLVFDEGEGGELGMAFLLEPEVAEVMEEVLGSRSWRAHAEACAKFGQQTLIVYRVITAMNSQVRDTGRRHQSDKGARMQFGGQPESLRVIRAGAKRRLLCAVHGDGVAQL